MVLVEKSSQSIFNMSESRRKPAVLIMFLEIKSLCSVWGEGRSHCTPHPAVPPAPSPPALEGETPDPPRRDQGGGCTDRINGALKHTCNPISNF